MTSPTREEIAERVGDLRGDAADVARNWEGSPEGDAIRWRMLRAADALEALAADREWKPIDGKAIDGNWYEVWVPREDLGTHECIFVAKHVKDFQDGDFWMDVADTEACIDPAPTHYRKLPLPPSTGDKEGAAS